MKNKKAIQIQAKKKHLENLRESRRKQKKLIRNKPILIEKPTILIVCEGKNTEVSYFKQFRLSSATIVAIGEGFNTISLVERAKILSADKKYDEVWCVFDKDDFEPEDFNSAVKMAQSLEFRVGYSNQAFEYWLLLHLDDHQGGGMHRSDYNTSINNRLKEFGIRYEGTGNKIIADDFFDILLGVDKKTNTLRIELAISRAERNHKQFSHNNPAANESSTSMYILAKEIIKYMS